MRFLVTGGAGFVGSHLVGHLLAHRRDAEVVTLDALTYAGHLESLAAVIDEPRHRFLHGDVCDPAAVEEALRGVDVVFHVAAESHVDRSIAGDAQFVRTNVVGTATILAAALAEGVDRFVQVSTDEVYGELPWVDPEEPSPPAGRPLFTEETPVAPRSPYSATKAAGDHLALAYHATHGLPAVVTRCSNNYGPRQFPEKLIPVLVGHALRDEPVPVYGDGLHVRDWLAVEDHCGGLLAVAERGTPGGVYHFGGRSERTNLSVAEAVLDALGKPESLIRLVPDRPGHDRRYGVAFERSRTELGWEPSTPFDDGVRRTVAWYAEHGDWCDAVLRTAAERGYAPRRAR